MHSPLPDSSALEAGILEDELPSRLSRVQDNVRNLLRASVFGSVHSSPRADPNDFGPIPDPETARTPLQSPVYVPSPHLWPAPPITQAELDSDVPSPSENMNRPCGVLFPPERVHSRSNDVDERALAAISHPDLSDPSLAVYLQHKARHRQRHAFVRRRRSNTRGRLRASRSGCLMCVLAGLLLAALLATYLSLALSWGTVSPIFHILFILAILLVTIIFAHSLIRLLILGETPRSAKSPTPPGMFVAQRRHHRRPMPTLTEESHEFVPATPIPVQVTHDERNRDHLDAPNASPSLEAKEYEIVTNPPPAYGRWRGSVRANPDLLHWQAQPSPDHEEVPDLPSPTYQEVEMETTNGTDSPPSYVTRDSPARRREMSEARADLARAQAVEPEMVEVGGIGTAF